MGKNHVTINEATKADDWKCTGGINAGDDSYRTYESESTGQATLVDGKNESGTLEILRGDDDDE